MTLAILSAVRALLSVSLATVPLRIFGNYGCLMALPPRRERHPCVNFHQSVGINKRAFLVAVFAAACTLNVFAQGSLTPPGAPAPTMKTLEEIEARTNIQRTINPLPSDANYHYIISTPGSYYLTGNLSVTKPNGIHVTVANVTIDLNGFRIARTSGVGGDGITVDPAALGCTVRNGAISGFAYGANCTNPSPGSISRGGCFENLVVSFCLVQGLKAGDGWLINACRAVNNTGAGISTGAACTIMNSSADVNTGPSGIAAGAGSTLFNCTATQNTGDFDYAIFASFGSTLINCSAYNNTMAFGIFAERGSTLLNCSANGNTSSRTESAGIRAIDTCTLTSCIAVANTNTTTEPFAGGGIHVSSSSVVNGCAATFNKGDGIHLGNNSSAHDCVANNNGFTNPSIFGSGSGITTEPRASIISCSAHDNIRDGIRTDTDTVVSGCHASGNVYSGIALGGTGNRIDGNSVRDNVFGAGIFVVATNQGHVIIRNSAGGNGSANYGLTAGNSDYAPIGLPSTVTSPFANFQ